MFNPRVSGWSKDNKDFGEKSLMPLLSFPIQPPSKYTKQAVIVSDSSFAETSFKIGLVVKLAEKAFVHCWSLRRKEQRRVRSLQFGRRFHVVT